MHKIIEKLYKYGNMKSEIYHEFDTLEDFNLKLNELKNMEDTDPIPDESPKWLLEVSASNGEMFTIPVNL